MGLKVHGANGTGGRRRGRNGEAFAESINFGPLAHWVGFNLRMAQEAAFQAFSRRSLEIGESPGRFATLTLIARNPGISQTELSHANGRDKSSRHARGRGPGAARPGGAQAHGQRPADLPSERHARRQRKY